MADLLITFGYDFWFGFGAGAAVILVLICGGLAIYTAGQDSAGP